MISTVVTTEEISSAASCAPGLHNEDRYFLPTHLENDLFAFGVFDGHGGSLGSQLCRDEYCTRILDRLVLRGASDERGDAYDMALCEAIYSVTRYTLARASL